MRLCDVSTMAKRKVRIQFTDFEESSTFEDMVLPRILAQRFELELSDNPDFVVYADGGQQYRKYNCTRIHFAIESHSANYRQCDYSLDFDFSDDPRQLRWPLYVKIAYGHGGVDALIRSPGENAEQLLAAKSKFCAFIYSNNDPRAWRRVQFFEMLSKYKRVDSCGRLMNNIGGPFPGHITKVDYCRDYKFTFAFENKAQHGYTSEKIVQPMFSRSVPLYWGNPDIATDFNPGSFVNVNDFTSLDEALDYVIALDQDDTRYCDMLSQPYLPENAPTKFFDEERLLDFFDRIFAKPPRRRKCFFLDRWLPRPYQN